MLQLLNKFQPSENDKKNIMALYNSIKDKSSLLNRCRPQSTAAGLVYFYIVERQKSITLKEYIKKVDLSELTIKKIMKEIERLVEENSIDLHELYS